MFYQNPLIVCHCFSDLPPKPVEAVQIHTKAPTGAVEFRDDVDLIEQVSSTRNFLLPRYFLTIFTTLKNYN